ncbi:GAF domain-containing protein [Nonomuraea roseola]|uniref:GAF domain-containing protein n=1 Tax=Nonomuraea roseola TaxID=46179 RepID=A0ABV5PTX3_9ACTN
MLFSVPAIRRRSSTCTRLRNRLAELGAGPALMVPLGAAQAVRGVITLVKHPGRLPFTGGDRKMVTSFAGQASIALELAEARGGARGRRAARPAGGPRQDRQGPARRGHACR